MEEKVVITVDHINSIQKECKRVKLRDGIEICVKPELTMKEFVYAVNSAASACFDFERGVYYPEAEVYMFRMSIIDAYTNLELPDDIEAAYKYVAYVWDDIRGAIDDMQLKNLEHAVRKNISFSRDDMVARRQRDLNELVEKMSELGTALGEAFSGIDINELNEIAKGLESLSEKINGNADNDNVAPNLVIVK